LRRADAFPVGDLALQIAAQRAKNLDSRPTQEQLLKIGEAWKPYRGVATMILWHAYVQDNRKKVKKVKA
ncbi:MAG: DNA-3-methyladenine glycosylase 2 family protein, partial [Pyrinomonadaceae bacterium]|nr:DNA-3-methyladenine glycosylase 2 family protein [Pyrinomonadaceae bacterium]